jgi:hypothetical protein
MSLLDNIGNNTINTRSNSFNNRNTLINNVATLIRNSGKSPKELAVGLMQNNPNMNGQLVSFLRQNGIKDDEINQLGIKY